MINPVGVTFYSVGRKAYENNDKKIKALKGRHYILLLHNHCFAQALNIAKVTLKKYSVVKITSNGRS